MFNAALETTMRRWKQRLEGAGLQLASKGASARLTDWRYADDLLLFVESLGESQRMLEALQDELGRAGPSITKKIKMPTTEQ